MTSTANQTSHNSFNEHNSGHGIIIEFQGDRLKVVGEASINIKDILEINRDALEGFKSTIKLLGQSGKYSASNLPNIVRTFNKAIRRVKCVNLSLASYLEMTAVISKPDKSRLLMLLKTWMSAGFSGLEDDLRKILSYENGFPPAKSNRLYTEIGGPYSDQEYDDLVSTFWHDYEHDFTDLQNTTLNLLNASHSRRPIQYAHLKICDFEDSGETNSVKGPRVSYPGAKDRNASGFRTSKQETHPLGKDLWRLCKLQITSTISQFEDWSGHKLSEDQKQQLPFFLSPYKARFMEKMAEVIIYAPPSEYFSSALWHLSSSSITKKLRARTGSPVHSFRTGQQLHEFCYRMRYTKIRQLARLGAPRHILSYWLGQESLTAIDSYYDDPAELAKNIEESMSYIYAPIAQAFMGCLVDRESDAIRGNDPSSRIELDGNKAVGSCGLEGFCTASVPVPCYRCSKFQPWVDGPHEEVLARLHKRQKEENNIFFQSKTRQLLTPLQLDRDIRAVETVIALCKKRQDNKK